ncbi:MAG TPA: hypothetical protein VFY63_14815 [Pseudorhizobium sp.]|nr:hypothetical protein [Pseudorhizobium sp.]
MLLPDPVRVKLDQKRCHVPRIAALLGHVAALARFIQDALEHGQFGGIDRAVASDAI